MRILVVNTGSISTKLAVFDEKDIIVHETIAHDAAYLSKYSAVNAQVDFRKECIVEWLNKFGMSINEFSCVAGRGGLLRPVPSGTYTVSESMVGDAMRAARGEHASNIGVLIAKALADEAKIPAFTTDPVSVDELGDIARISGLMEIERIALSHALNIKAVSKKASAGMGKSIDELNFIVAHIGSGISVVPIEKGRMIDTNNANEMGPFSPQRSGSLPVGDVVSLAFSLKYTRKEMIGMVNSKGGLVSYLGTSSIREVEKMIANGDEHAKFILDAMAYQISKEIGAMATVLDGKVDRIILTGGGSGSGRLVSGIRNRAGFIAPIEIICDSEMESLAYGALSVLNGTEKAKSYDEVIKESGWRSDGR